ncbi:MarR family winged helix-turn-helix transcriptional regulator [Yinghuangia soli]|uniref:MarR family transcriptional regulator n=1 Tax=Yinghuangia soli TaxID=2908204 RepID=A0AA41U2S8_9ACTN|nr:MarR family transcriptional regulator [Yinghuangia soli]MCF2531000.1 MarR family transcriptional regulator [Yinghuangia soli]
MAGKAENDPAVRRIEAFLGQITSMSRLPATRRRLRRLADIDTHDSGVSILLLLRRTGPLSVTDLARHLGVNQSTASRQVAPLEEDGFLTRTEHPSHRRISLLDLSDEGRAACERAQAVGRRDIAWAIKDWTPQDRAMLGELLERFGEAWSKGAESEGLGPDEPTTGP